MLTLNHLLIIRHFYIISFLLLQFTTNAEQQSPSDYIDSLKQQLKADLDDKEMVNTYILIGTYYKNRDNNKIDEYADAAIALSKKINYDKGLSDAYYLKSATFIWQGDYDNTWLYLDSTEFYALKSNHQAGLGKVYNGKGFIFRLQNDFDSALYYNYKALETRKAIDDMEGVAANYHSLALIYDDMGDDVNSYELVMKSLEICNEYQLESQKVYALNLLSTYHNAKGNYDLAIELLQQNLDISIRHNKIQQIADTYLNIGETYKDKGDYPLALENYYKSLEIYEKNEMYQGKEAVLNSIGAVHFFMGNADEAVASLKKALDISIDLDHKVQVAGLYNDLGYIMGMAGRFEEAYQNLNKGLELAESLNAKKEIAIINASTGEVYLEQNNLPKARYHLQKAIDTYREIGFKSELTEYLISLSRINIASGNLNEALDQTAEALMIAQNIGSKSWIANCARLQADIYSRLGRWQDAYHSHVLYKQMTDSIMNSQNIRKFALLEADYGFQKEKDSIANVQMAERLIFDAKLEKQQARQRMTLMGFATVVLIAFILGVFFYQNKKKNNELARLNQEVQNQNIEIKAKRDHLEDLNNTKSKFFSIISHDLRSPMSSFQALSDVIDFHLEEENYDELKEITQEVVRRSKEINQLLDNLLNWAVEEQGEFPFHPEEIEVNPVLDEVIALYRPLSTYKDITLKMEISANHQRVYADKNCLTTILRNLISNAIKFTKTGGTITIRTFQRESEPYLNFEITDSGLGMPQEKANQIFRSGQLQSTKGTSGEKGVGLGLQLVRDFVTMNAGMAKVDSQEGKGSTFTISLPVQRELQEA